MCGVFPFLLLSVLVIPDTRVINVENEKVNSLVILDNDNVEMCRLYRYQTNFEMSREK